MTKKQEEWKKECLEALQEAKEYYIRHQGKQVVEQIFQNILEVDDFPSQRDTIYPVTEEKMVQSIWYSTAQAVESVFNTVIRMVEDDVLQPNGDMASKVAKKLRDQNENTPEEDMELEPDEDDYNLEPD